MTKLFIIHPVLFALYPVLFLYSYNIDKLYPHEICIPLVAVLASALILWFLINLIVKNNECSAAVVSVFLLMFFSYQHYLLAMIGIIHKGFFTRDEFLFPLWIAVFILVAYLILKKHLNLHNLTISLNIMAITLFLLCTFNIINYEITKRFPFQHRQHLIEEFIKSTNDVTTQKSSSLPDIYYIIFDRYANSKILKEYFNYDNTEFTNYLEKKGFFVAYESTANYPKTFLSLGSSLNLNHLDFIVKKVGEESRDQTITYDLLNDYNAWRFLKSKGYKFIHFGSSWGPTKKNKFADYNFNYLALDEFSTKLLKNTLLLRFIKNYMDDTHKKLALCELDKLSKVPYIKGPKFTFAHFLIPHEPFVFDENGNDSKEHKKKKMEQKYIDQLIFTNKKIKLLVDELISKSATAPIIILQSDEGPYAHKELKNEIGSKVSNWEHLSKDALKIHLHILNAYYLPGVNSSVLYKSITPVNTFRIIFNLYFGTKYKLLKDESFIFIDDRHPYKFINVSEVVKFH